MPTPQQPPRGIRSLHLKTKWGDVTLVVLSPHYYAVIVANVRVGTIIKVDEHWVSSLFPKERHPTRHDAIYDTILGWYANRRLVQQALVECQELRLPFSWLSTRCVCQAWDAHFATYPDGRAPNARVSTVC